MLDLLRAKLKAMSVEKRVEIAKKDKEKAMQMALAKDPSPEVKIALLSNKRLWKYVVFDILFYDEDEQVKVAVKEYFLKQHLSMMEKIIFYCAIMLFDTFPNFSNQNDLSVLLVFIYFFVYPDWNGLSGEDFYTNRGEAVGIAIHTAVNKLIKMYKIIPEKMYERYYKKTKFLNKAERRKLDKLRDNLIIYKPYDLSFSEWVLRVARIHFAYNRALIPTRATVLGKKFAASKLDEQIFEFIDSGKLR